MKNLAIIIANSEYDNQNNLDCCEDDALAIQELFLETKKYDEVLFSLNEKSLPTKERIRLFLNNASDVNEITFYFSGHGYQHNNEFYFCAKDFDSSKPNESGLSLTELHTLLRSADANLVVKIIDACHSGTLLLKSDVSFLPESKGSFKSIIQIASCLDSQYSLTGNPLSVFTEKFRNSAISRESGPVYYYDIISSLRDAFSGNSFQTPHFISQGTGQEKFVEDGSIFKNIRDKINAVTVSSQTTTSKPIESLSLLDRVTMIDESYVSAEDAQIFINKFFDEIKKRFEAHIDFSDLFDLEYRVFEDFYDESPKKFIVKVLSNNDRPDNFVHASIKHKGDNNIFSSTNVVRNIMEGIPGYTDTAEYNLKLNPKMEQVQICLVMKPKYQCLKQFTLIISCAPSLDKCYVFEYLKIHSLEEWGSFGSGSEINRRWYQIDWNSETDNLVGKFVDYLHEVISKHIDTVTLSDDET